MSLTQPTLIKVANHHLWDSSCSEPHAMMHWEGCIIPKTYRSNLSKHQTKTKWGPLDRYWSVLLVSASWGARKEVGSSRVGAVEGDIAVWTLASGQGTEKDCMTQRQACVFTQWHCTTVNFFQIMLWFHERLTLEKAGTGIWGNFLFNLCNCSISLDFFLNKTIKNKGVVLDFSFPVHSNLGLCWSQIWCGGGGNNSYAPQIEAKGQI